MGLLCPAVMFSVLSGQTSLLVGAAVLAGVLTLPTRPLLAGLLFAITATIKPQSVTLVPLALIAGSHWRTLAACLVAGLAIGGASYLAAPDLWRDWLNATQEFMVVVDGLEITHRALSARGLADLFHLTGPAAWALIAAASGLGVGVVALVWRSTSEPLIRTAALSAGSLIVSPYAMGYDAALLSVVGLALLLDRSRPVGHWLAGAVLVTAAGPVLVTAGAGALAALVTHARMQQPNRASAR